MATAVDAPGSPTTSPARPPRARRRERPEVVILKGAVFVNALVPLGLLVWDGLHARLGVNPVEFITRTTGVLTLAFLLLTLAVTPAKRFLGATLLPRVRRMLGLYACFYGALHFLTWLWLDKFFSLKGVVEDLLGRLFLTVGAVAFFSMIPLAISSTDRAIQRMGGERWKQQHQRIYFIAIAGTIHYFLAVKADLRRPIVFAVILAVLLGARMLPRRAKAPRPPAA